MTSDSRNIGMTTGRPAEPCIQSILKRHAAQTPDAVAIATPNRAPLTYRRLWTELVDVAAVLKGSGIDPDDRVALVIPDGPEMAVAFLGVSAAATAAPLNPSCREGEFDAYLDDLNVKMLITTGDDDSPAVIAARTRSVPVVRLTCTNEAPAGVFTLNPSPATRHHSGRLPDGSDVALVLTTSGTTSRPKIVALTHANVCASALNIAASLGLCPDDRCMDVMPLFHIHGLIGGLLSSLAAGGSVICPPGFDAPRFFDWMDELAPTWYTAVPTMHQAILARAGTHGGVIERRPLRFIRSSSSALPKAVSAALETAFKAPVTEAYGMTEASHQIARNPLPPDVRKAGSVGVPFGADIAILDDRGNRLPAGRTAEIAIRGASVITAYEGNPSADERSFSDGWLRTGDSGYLDEDGYLFITGRLKEVINRGGEKISPREVDDVLLDHPAIAQAAVFGMPHEALGQDIAAAVVLRPGAVCTERELRELVAARLAHFKVPARIVFLDQLPKGPTGKLQRNMLAEQLDILAVKTKSVAERSTFIAPTAPLEMLLAAMWTEILKVASVGLDDNFFHLGGDSILAARFLARVRRELGADLSFVAFFDQPTLAEVARAVASQQTQLPTAGNGGIVPRPAGESPALSFGQERLWFLDQWEPRSAVYNVPNAMCVTGPLDPVVFEQSMNAVVARHEVLRTHFGLKDGRPVQLVEPATTVPLRLLDLTGVAGADRETEAARLIAAEAQEPFDLSRGPLVRALAVRLADDEHLVLLTIHHIVCDGWSMSVVFDEIAACYNAFITGAPAPLSALPIQYADFAMWQRQRLQGDELERQLAYWKYQLRGPLPVLQLPSGQSRPAVSTSRGAQHPVRLSRGLTDRIAAISRKERVTLFMTLLAAFQTLLFRYTGQDDVSVGTAIAGRNETQLERLIGFFVNTLVLRTDLSGDPTFRELLARVRSVTLGAYVHQDVPFEKLVEELQPTRSLAHSPLCQTFFVLHSTPIPAPQLHGLAAVPFALALETAKFDISLSLRGGPDGLSGTLEYRTDLFDTSTMERFAAHFEILLEGIVADPDQRLSELPLLTGAERRQLLVEWNDTDAAFPSELCVHQLVEAQVQRTPKALAVVYEDESITYETLNARANRLARTLRARGVGPDVVVGLCLERSIDLIVGLLGILKAGGAYVPMDPIYPRDRARFMLEEASARILVTDARLAARLDAPNVHTVCMDTDPALLASGRSDNLASSATPDNLAYVIFTSGSTGRPKGVMMPHRSVSNYLHWAQTAFSLTSDDRVLQRTSCGFDVSGWEFYAPLLAGAELVMAPPGAEFDPAQLVATMAAGGVTVLQAVPSVLAQLLDEPELSRCGSLRLVLCGGEALSYELQERFSNGHAGPPPHDLSGHVWPPPLFNLYGPTETCIFSTGWMCRPGERVVPIGRPVGNTQLYVLDSGRQLAPIGVAGELYIGGAGLARGYINRPELTADCFVPHPFSDEPGARLYRTGDRVRYRRDGTVEYLGRVDHQVKIRGLRIEPAEIEGALRRHTSVGDAVVVAREDVPGDRRLVAYLVCRKPPAPSSGDLRLFLRETLPETLVPSTFVWLDGLPASASGKIDRHRLPVPDTIRPVQPAAFTSPRTAVETAIAVIWSEILRIDRIGIHDNFFDLGGHSLLATQVISRVNAIFGRRVSLRRLFETPTIAGLAQAVEDSQTVQADAGRAGIKLAPREMFRTTRERSTDDASSRR